MTDCLISRDGKHRIVFSYDFETWYKMEATKINIPPNHKRKFWCNCCLKVFNYHSEAIF